MENVEITEIAGGVEGCYIKTSKFKTSRISINMFVPMDKDKVSAYSLLTGLLTRSSKKYYNYTLLNARLNELYGASLYGGASKLGDMQVLKFVISVIDDKYTPDNSDISAEAAELLLSMIFNPPLENGVFRTEDFESEQRLLIENINSEINDKRRYAIMKTEGLVYADEPCGTPAFGTAESARELTPQKAVDAWRSLLDTAFVRVNVISDSSPEGVFGKIGEYFSKSERCVKKNNPTVKHSFDGKVKTLEEHMDVTQGKLCMAFSLDIGDDFQSSINAKVMTDIFGGGPYSKLFENVREKQSLCYYCAARMNDRKGVILVDSGVLEENRGKAYDGILEQLEQLKSGNVSEDTLKASKMAVIDSANTIGDFPPSLDSWYVTKTFEENSIEKYIEAVGRVTVEDVVNAAKTAKLNAVYYLGGNESGEENA